MTTRPDGSTLHTGYWPDGSVEDQVDGNSADTHYTYDPLGHLSGVTDPDGRTTGYLEDGDGNLLVRSDPGVSGCTTTSTGSGCTIDTYDADNELTGVTYNNTNTPNVTAETYDGDGRRVTMTEQHGAGTATSTWSYDSLGDLSAATDVNGATVSYGYDTRQDQTSIVYPGTTGALSAAFDSAGREKTLTDWLGKTTSFTYDADNDLGSQMSPTVGTALVDTYGYDNVDADSSIAVTQGATSLASFAYGRNNNNAVNSVTSTGVPADNTTETYNTLGQLSKVSTTGTDAYDPADNPTQLSGTVQAFDPADQLTATSTITVVGTASAANTATTTTVTLPAGVTTNDQIIAAVTLEAGPTVTTPTGYTLIGTYTAGTGATKDQTLLYRLTATGPTTTATFTFSTAANAAIDVAVYRGANPTNPIDQTTTASASNATTDTVPTLTPTQSGDQLVLIQGATGQTTAGTFTTPAGMTAETATAAGTPVYGAVTDQLLNSPAATGTRTVTFSQTAQLVGTLLALKPATTSYTYDTRGNRTAITPPTGTATTLGYDQANRLVTATTPAATTTYTYNGDGLRMTKTVAGTTETYTYDQTGTTPAIIADGGTNYIYGPQGLPLEQITGSTVLWYHHDQLGSTRALTNTAGAVVGTATYNAYGKTTATTGTVTPFGYTGAYTDTETGYLYLNTRYYDPNTAQFLSRDPMDASTLSAYSYVLDDPLNGVDPLGLCISCLLKTGLKDVLNTVAPGSGTIAADSTTKLCVSVGVGAIVGFSGNVCVGQSHLDQLGVSATRQGGADVLGSAGVAVSPSVSNAQSFGDLGGPFSYDGGSVGPVSGEYTHGKDKCGNSVNVGSLGGQLDISDLSVSGRYGHSDTATGTWSLPWRI